VSLTYDFGDGNTAGPTSDQNYVHTYQSDGDYSASIKARDNLGMTATAVVTVSVLGKPGIRGAKSKGRNEISIAECDVAYSFIPIDANLPTKLLPSAFLEKSFLAIDGASRTSGSAFGCFMFGETYAIRLVLPDGSQSEWGVHVLNTGALTVIAGDPSTFFVDESTGDASFQESPNEAGTNTLSISSGGCGRNQKLTGWIFVLLSVLFISSRRSRVADEITLR